MDKDTIMLDLYKGRVINSPIFEEYFHPNGAGNTKESICYVDNDVDGEYSIHVYFKYSGIIDRVEFFKADIYGGHGRPTVNEKKLNASEKKYAYSVLDMCTIEQAVDEVDQVIESAVSNHAEYNGYSIIKRIEDGIQFVSPEGKKSKVRKLIIAKALNYSHVDLQILRDPNYAKEFMALFGKTAYEPVYAVLQGVDEKAYINYPELEREYRFAMLDKAVEAADEKACSDYAEAINYFPGRASKLFRSSVLNNETMLSALIDAANDDCIDLNAALAEVIWYKNKTAFDYLLNSGKCKPQTGDRLAWNAPMSRACDAGYEYVYALLKKGYKLPFTSGFRFLEKLSVDQLVSLIEYGVYLDGDSVNRIIDAGRLDAIKDLITKNGHVPYETVKKIFDSNYTELRALIENNPEKNGFARMLMQYYIEISDRDRFFELIDKGYTFQDTKMFVQAFRNGTDWADKLVENGFDVNQGYGSLLRDACETSDDELAIYLLDNGADPHLRDQYERSKILEAVDKLFLYGEEKYPNAERICRKLMECGADPVAECDRSPSCICYMMQLSTEFKHYLVDWLADHNYLNAPDTTDERGVKHVPLYYPLQKYSRDFDEDLARYMIEKGAKVDASGITNDKLFYEAAGSCSAEFLALMLERGANVNEESSNSSLDHAIIAGAPLETIKLFVEAGADINSYLPSNNIDHGYATKRYPARSCLDSAEKRKEDPEIAQYLKNLGALRGSELEQRDK